MSDQATSANPSIEHLALAWAAIDALCSTLSDDDWRRPTGCPGWSVQDQVAHLVDYESRALGRPAPEHTPAQGPHLKNDLGRSNEIGVDHRRASSPAALLEEFRDVTAARLAQLRTLTDDDMKAEVLTPAGPGTVADMLTLRVMDTWSHEQDIRRAVGRPGGTEGPAVDEAIGYFARFLPYVVGKRAGAPDGTIAVFLIGDDRRFGVVVDGGRARAATDVPEPPTVTVSMPVATFAALVGGRSDVPDDVVITGDTALGRAIVDGLAIMP